jgi:hypothetical protein
MDELAVAVAVPLAVSFSPDGCAVRATELALDQQVVFPAAAVAAALPAMVDNEAVASTVAPASSIRGPFACAPIHLLSLQSERVTQHRSSLARKAYLNGAPIMVVHDTGATKSFITHEIVHKTGLIVQACQPVTVILGDGSLITISTRCRARLRLLVSEATRPKYHKTTVEAYVLPPISAGCTACDVDCYLGVDWQYANATVLDFSKVPFDVSIAETATLSPQAAWERPPAITALSVLTAATDALFAASTVSLLSDRQCKRLLRQKGVAQSAFAIVVRTASASESAFSPLLPVSGEVPIVSSVVPHQHLSGRAAVPSCPGRDNESLGQDKDSIILPAVGDGPVDSELMTSLLLKYKHLFAAPTGLPPDRDVGTVIPLAEHATPQFVRGRRLSPSELTEVKAQVTDLLAKGYIQPSSSPWGAPVLFIPKPDGSMRMAIDYRKLNQLTTPNRWPLPHIDELLDQVREARVFSLLDLRSGYHQIKLQQEDIVKTAFITPVGLFEFKVLPFGLCNAPAVFTRYMTKLLGHLLGTSVVVYLDDILVYSKTPGEHLEHLDALFKILEQNQLFANGKKCTLNREELKYLGHIVGHGELKVDSAKITSIRDWPVPTYPKELQSFLGLANYFSKFVQGYSTLAAPLTSLVALTAPKTKRLKGTLFTSEQWLPKHSAAFEAIKSALCEAPVLRLADPTLPYRVISDASSSGTGAVLMQDEHPIAYLSHKFSTTEARYHTGEQELLGVILALKAWRCYVQGCSGGLTLVTDHHPLTYLNTQPHLSPKQVRWSQYLSTFMPFKWEYIPGRLNVADPLSRHPLHEHMAASVTHFDYAWLHD